MKLTAELESNETTNETMARVATSPECLSASVLTLCQSLDHSQITEMVEELQRQTAAIHKDDMRRAESMLAAQAHTLDGLFARLTGNAFTANSLDVLERYMRLALKAQSQAQATLRTLAELKVPNQVAFVKQANIGNQLQVNNGSPMCTCPRTRKNKNEPNELLEAQHGKRMDTRTTRSTGNDDPAMAAVEKKHRPDYR